MKVNRIASHGDNSMTPGVHNLNPVQRCEVTIKSWSSLAEVVAEDFSPSLEALIMRDSLFISSCLFFSICTIIAKDCDSVEEKSEEVVDSDRSAHVPSDETVDDVEF